MIGNFGEKFDDLGRLAHLELLFMDLERTVSQLNQIVRDQQSRLEFLEATVRRWRLQGADELPTDQ